MFKVAVSWLVLGSLLVPLAAIAEVKVGTSSTHLEGSLENLKLFEKPPEAVTEMYVMAHKILAAKRDASYADLAANEAFQDHCRTHGITHLGGPMLGCVSDKGVRVWVRTLKPAEVAVTLTIGDQIKTFGPVRSTLESDLTAIVTVDGLDPETRYPYSVSIDGKPIMIPDSAVIATSPSPATTGKVRIAFGSCPHRWGLGNPAQSEVIRSRNPAAMLLLGDISSQDRNNNLGLHRADYLLRDQLRAWQTLSSAVPVYASWDDHDYFANDKSGIPKGFTLKDKQEVCDLFVQSWNNPAHGFGDERRGVFLRTRIGPCDVIMTDNRYFRDPEKGAFFGQEQLQWLEEQLLDCKGPFIILSCGTMWSDYVSGGKDSWGAWDREGRERIFSFIEKNNIAGVLLISGDRHGARGFRIPRPSGFEFFEFEAASLGARSGPPIAGKDWNTKLYGIANRYAFGEFSIDATLDDPEATFQLIGDDREVIYNLTLKRSQLTPQKK